MTDWRIVGPFIAAMIGLFGWLAKHISNTKKHPCKDDVVFKDVCDAKQNGLENEIKNLSNRVTDLRIDMKDGFCELKTLIKNGL